MNKKELSAAVADRVDLTEKEAGAAVTAVFDIISEELKKHEKVQIIGFGTFQTTERAARTGRNPRTGEELNIPASITPVFKAGKTLKEAVNVKEQPKKKGSRKK